MKKVTLSVLIAIVCLLGGYAIYLFQNNNTSKSASQTETATNDTKISNASEINDIPSLPEAEEEKFTGLLNMDKWLYNDEDKVYYQTGIYYSQASLDSEYQKMALFVPEKYLRCNELESSMYSCEPNMAARVNIYTVRSAPVVTEINSPDFAAEPALTRYRNIKEYTDAGLVYAHIGFRGGEHGAPAAVTDLKAAVHFIKYNKERFPGNTDFIFAIGANRGATLAAILATSGNNRLYSPYLKEIGALTGLNDSIKGVMIINPISGLDTYNEAVEWLFNNTRRELTDEQKKLSEKMAQQYAAYINRAGFIGPYGNALTLQYSAKGVYQKGTYYDYIKSTLTNSLNDFFKENDFPYNVPKSWEISEDKVPFHNNVKLAGTYQTKYKFFEALNAKKTWIIDRGSQGFKITNLDEFFKIFITKQPPLASMDGLNKERIENILFGTGNGKRVHFDSYMAKALKNTPQGKDFENDLYQRDKYGYNTTKRLDMYNPLYYILPSYEGYKTSTVAPYWRIRSGLFQNSNVLISTVNLFLAINHYLDKRHVDYKAVWGMGDIEEIQKKDRMDFINWIERII